MIKLYDAANLQEAYLLAGLLRHEGMNPRILNENALGGAGEIPFAHAYPQLIRRILRHLKGVPHP